MIIEWGQVASGLALAVPSFALGYLAYRRSKKVDAITEQSGAAAGAREGTAQIINGLNTLVDQLQEGAGASRETTRYLQERLDAVLIENEELKRELARLRKRYGENGE